MVYSAKLHVTKTGLYKLVSQQYSEFPKMKETDFKSGRGKRSGCLCFCLDDIYCKAFITVAGGGVVFWIRGIQDDIMLEEKYIKVDIALLKELGMVKEVICNDC